MKKYIALLALVLCVLLLCSCGNTSDKNNNSPAETQQTVTEKNGDDNTDLNTESTSPENDAKASAADTNTASDSGTADKTDTTDSSGNSGNSSQAGGSQAGDNSGNNGEQPPFTADEYELPFIAN